MSRQQFKETITVRKNLDFGFDGDDIPRYWLAGNAFKTRLVDAVQATFPDGERYFISSVRAFRERIKDSELLQAVKDFTMQEGQHGQVHTEFNARLKRQGIAVEAFTKHTKKMCDDRLKTFSEEYNVALTAALEHFTAMMADLFFAEKGMMAGADPRVRAMMAWHAVEEMEHKAVAFDVMQQVAGVGYTMRSVAMLHATASFLLFTTVAPWFMLGMDGYSRRERLRLYVENAPWLFGPRKGLVGRLMPMLATYFRPDFHPNDLPSVHNYRTWIDTYLATGDAVKAAEAMYAAAA